MRTVKALPFTMALLAAYSHAAIEPEGWATKVETLKALLDEVTAQFAIFDSKKESFIKRIKETNKDLSVVHELETNGIRAAIMIKSGKLNKHLQVNFAPMSDEKAEDNLRQLDQDIKTIEVIKRYVFDPAPEEKLFTQPSRWRSEELNKKEKKEGGTGSSKSYNV